MTSSLRFFTKPTSLENDHVEWEPLPADGEPIYVTHPAFSCDAGLRHALDAYQFLLVLHFQMWRVKNPSASPRNVLKESRAWLAGDIPIPQEHWEEMLASRKRWLKVKDLPLDAPVGFQHPDFQPPSDQPKQPAPPLQAAS